MWILKTDVVIIFMLHWSICRQDSLTSSVIPIFAIITTIQGRLKGCLELQLLNIHISWWKSCMEPSANPQTNADASNTLTKHFFIITNTCTPAYLCKYQISQSRGSSAGHKIMTIQVRSFSKCLQQTLEWGQKYDLSDFGLIVGARQFQYLKLLISWDFQAQQSLQFTQNGAIS